MARKPLHTEELKKMILLMFLVNSGEEGVSYASMRTLSRRYLLNEFNGILKNTVAQGLVLYAKNGDAEHYTITADGIEYFEKLGVGLKEQIDEHYPIQKDLTSLLLD
ncbi:MAG: hypothetical protein V4616_01560 [Bacteroidota bacterium]